MKIIRDTGQSVFHDQIEDLRAIDPRQYFQARFSEQIKRWGPAIFGSETFVNGRPVFIPDSLNDLTLAAVIGGDRSLGHHVVFHPPESQFYYLDYRTDNSYCPTTEDKLGILASHYLIQSSQRCHPLAAKAILKLRTPQTIKVILTTARTILEADGQFFAGKHGHRRLVDGRYIEPNDEPSYQVFVKMAIVREPSAKLTVGDAFHRYYQFCKENAMQPLTRSDFKELVAEVIREQYDLGIRHNIVGENGRHTHGWLGLNCRLEGASPSGLN